MVNFYSESDFLQKFWSPMFEAFFAESEFITHWGDTKFWSCKQEEVDVMLDFRLFLGPSKKEFDTGTGEFAKRPTHKKLYADRLKSTVAAKAIINSIFQNSSLIVADLASLKSPIIQVMGFECQIFTVTLVEPKLDTLDKVFEMNFPVTYKDLRKFGITSILQGLSLVEDLSINVKDIINQEKMFENSNKMNLIDSGKKEKKLSRKEWTTSVKQFPKEDFEREEEE